MAYIIWHPQKNVKLPTTFYPQKIQFFTHNKFTHKINGKLPTKKANPHPKTYTHKEINVFSSKRLTSPIGA